MIKITLILLGLIAVFFIAVYYYWKNADKNTTYDEYTNYF